MSGPLAATAIVEIAALGAVPFAGMMLSDLGADVVRIDRVVAGSRQGRPYSPMDRGRRSIAVDLKHPDGRQVVLDLLRQADGVMEGFRPGVMEKLKLGPNVVLAANPRIVYGRMTGWGQTGPLANAAGHDINYVALSGPLAHIGAEGRPPDVPLNLVGDMGGGGMLLAVGMLAGLLAASRSGAGQVVDAAMVDGAALMMASMCGALARGDWQAERGTNLTDGGAPFYGVYETADHRYVAVGAIEPRFYQQLADLAGLPLDPLDDRMNRTRWPETRRRLEKMFASRSQAEWRRLLEGTDACFAPVLPIPEAAGHPQLSARSTYVTADGVLQPAPAPRFNRTPGQIRGTPPDPGQHTMEILESLEYPGARIAELITCGAVA